MRDPIEQLRRIHNALVKIASYERKGQRKFEEEEDIRLSIIYYLQTISEAARALSFEYRKQYPDIPWQQLIDFQNYITYYYREIDLEGTWEIIHIDLPHLKPKIDALPEHSVKHDQQKNRRQLSTKNAIAIRELLRAKRDDILRTASAYGVSNVRVFGSIVRGEADKASETNSFIIMMESI